MQSPRQRLERMRIIWKWYPRNQADSKAGGKERKQWSLCKDLASSARSWCSIPQNLLKNLLKYNSELPTYGEKIKRNISLLPFIFSRSKIVQWINSAFLEWENCECQAGWKGYSMLWLLRIKCKRYKAVVPVESCVTVPDYSLSKPAKSCHQLVVGLR